MPTCFASKPIWASISIVCVFALVAGCSGRGAKLSAVHGIVKANGKAVSEGEVMFYPVGGGRPAVGQIGPDGRYELTSFVKNDGVVTGSHKVTISAYKTTKRNNAAAPNSIDEETVANMAEARIIWLIPEKFSELRTTTLTAEVEAGKSNEINFDSAEFE